MIKIYDDLMRPEAALTYPHFELIHDWLYRVSCDTHTEKEHTQLFPDGAHCARNVSWFTWLSCAHYR